MAPGFLAKIGSFFKNTWNGIKNVATKAWDGTKNVIRKIMPVAQPIVSTAAQAMQAAPDPRIQITGTGLEWANRYLSQL